MTGRPPAQNDCLGGILYRSLFPTEEDRYKGYFKEDWWSLEEFACLMAGTIPEVYQGILAKNEKYMNLKNIKRALEANKIFRRFLSEIEEIRVTDEIRHDQNYAMSSWRFMKWAAIKDLPIKRRFLDALPFPLLEIFLEFLSENSPLHTKPKSSQAYHRALYLKAAKNLVGKFEYRLSRDEIYDHPRMQSALRQIRALGGHYKKRTITDAWLAQLEERKKGRPKKKELIEK